MQRLLQGEVGSGKTVVAVSAMLQAVGSGHQAVLVAPTQVLAEQHYQSISNVFNRAPVLLLKVCAPTKLKPSPAMARAKSSLCNSPCTT